MDIPHSIGNAGRAIVLRGLLLSLLWWALSAGRADAWIMGAPAIVLAVAASLRLSPARSRRLSLAGLASFAVFFVVQSVKAGTQVALMALRPRPDLRPALLEVELRLADEAARVALAATLNLLPGTLSTGLEGRRLHVHMLDRRMPVEAEIREAEVRIARMLRLELPQ